MLQRRATVVVSSVVLGAALFGAGTAFGTGWAENKTVTELTRLEDLKGLPCGEGTQFGPGRTDFRIYGPKQASIIQWACITARTEGIPNQEDIPDDLYPPVTDDLLPNVSRS